LIDRAVNLLTLFIVFLALIVLASNLHDAWEKSEPWEQNWIAIKEKEQKYESDKLITAIKNARDQREYSDAYILEEALESMYRPSGEVLKRFNAREIQDTMEYVFLALVLLIAPISINYVRHGKFKLWNKSA